MIPLLSAILLASLLGSWHCAGMCGAFVALATGRIGDRGTASEWEAARLAIAYHLGRLATYTALGAAAGAAGGLINLTGALGGIGSIATALAALTLTGVGFVWLMRALGVGGAVVSHKAVPWMPVIRRLHRAALGYPPNTCAFLIGLFTTLLPCGWLYTFAVTAAGTGKPLAGALVMATFWLGTLPALAVVGSGARRLLGSLATRMPAATAVLVIAAGLYTLSTRASLTPAALAAQAQRHSSHTPSAADAACCVDLHGSAK
jgi:sulfite exporter TauE/SafE